MASLGSISLDNVSLALKGVHNKWTQDYFDILSDGKPIRFVLDSRFLLTERGIYNEFVKPSRSLQRPLNQVTELCKKYGNPVKEGKSSYLDIVLDLSNELDRALYEGLKDLQTKLVDKVYESIKQDTGPMQKYLEKYCRSNKNKLVKGLFLQDNYSKDNIKYVHLKVTKMTRSLTLQEEEIDTDLLSYKTYKTVPVLRVDNVRIPIGNVNLNIHLCIEEQIVEEHVSIIDSLVNLMR